MIEFVVFLIIVGAVWFYLQKKNDTEASASESDKKPATTQVSTEKPESKPTPEPVKAKPVVSKPLITEPVSVIPEDSALRRHYLQNLATEQDDSSSSAADSKGSAVEEVVIPASTKTEIPVEKELKRDVIQQLVAETEATMPPRPTDSTLKRHYDTQLMSVVLSKLQEAK